MSEKIPHGECSLSSICWFEACFRTDGHLFWVCCAPPGSQCVRNPCFWFTRLTRKTSFSCKISAWTLEININHSYGSYSILYHQNPFKITLYYDYYYYSYMGCIHTFDCVLNFWLIFGFLVLGSGHDITIRNWNT